MSRTTYARSSDGAIPSSATAAFPARRTSPDHAPRGPFLHVRAAHARRRPVRSDRFAATRSATRLGLICLARRRIGARSPAAHPLGARRSATARNRSEEHTSELQSPDHLVFPLL